MLNEKTPEPTNAISHGSCDENSENAICAEKITPKKLYFFILSVGLLGLILLASVNQKAGISFALRKLKYNGYPNIAYFNRAEEKPTLTITNFRNHCTIDQWTTCWDESTFGNEKDTIAVRLYFKNNSKIIAKGTRIGIALRYYPKQIKFYGGVNSLNGPRTSRICTLKLLEDETLSYFVGSGSFDINFNPTVDIKKNVTSDSLFADNGSYIGDVKPGNEGVIVVYFLVVKNSSKKR